jgi:hypothetical protein
MRFFPANLSIVASASPCDYLTFMKTLSDNLPNSCRLLQIIPPFETWAGTSEDAIRSRVREALKAGIGGLVTNIPVENYLRDEKAFAILRLGITIAHAEGMRIWIYDEEGYPSGAAGGEVLEKVPSAEAQGLIRVVDAAGQVRYDVITLYEATHATENFYKKRPYINILDPSAVSTFTGVTHDRYARVLDPIDRYVEAFFTDEPSLISVYIPQGRDYPKTLPWHARLPEEFRTRKGYDLLPYRESLFVDTGDKGLDRKTRCDFYEVIADLCAETYFGGLQEWCHRHKVASSGHLLGEEKMIWQTEFDGDPFTCYRKFDIPGIDLITSDPEKIMGQEFFLVPKVAGSAARLQGKKRVMCEISDFFGMMDKKHASIEQMKCTAGILFSCGVTDLCSYYSVSLDPEHELKEFEIPPAEYSKYTNFTARLNAIFTAGTIGARVAVLYPIVSLWAHFTPPNRSMYEDHPNPDVRYLDKAFCELCRSLMQQQIDYDIVDEKSLASAKIEGKTLAIGERPYEALVLPPLDTIRLQTMQMIVNFAEAGGAVFAHGLLPQHTAEGRSDGLVPEMLDRLRATGNLGGSQPGSPPVAYLLKSRVLPDCTLSPASLDIVWTPVRSEERQAHFFVNSSSKEYEGTCTFRKAGEFFLYDPSTGEEWHLTQEVTGVPSGGVRLRLKPFQALFIFVR